MNPIQSLFEWLAWLLAGLFSAGGSKTPGANAQRLVRARTMTRFDHDPMQASVSADAIIAARFDLVFLNWWQFDPGTLRRIVAERRNRGKLTGFYVDRHVVRRDDSGLWGRSIGGVTLDETALQKGVFLRAYDTFGRAFITNADHPVSDDIARFMLERIQAFDPDAVFYDDLGIHWVLTESGKTPHPDAVRRNIRALKRDRAIFSGLMPNAVLVVNTDWASWAVTFSSQRGTQVNVGALGLIRDLTGLTFAAEGFVRESVYWNHGQPDNNPPRFAAETRWFAHAMRVARGKWFTNLDYPATEAQARQVAFDLARLGPYNALGLAKGVGLGLAWFVPFGED
jgi:hypothetical protein